MAELPRAFYEPADGTFVPTGLTRGPWNPEHQHAGPPAALLARVVERAGGIEIAQAARLSFDILRPVPLVPLVVRSRTLRPGRRVELVEAELTAEEHEAEPLMRATAWRIRAEEVRAPASHTGAELAPPPGPEHGRPGSFGFWRNEVAYHRALDWRFIDGAFDTPGPATVWTRLRVPLVLGEEATPLERLLVMADAASGVSSVLDWSRWSFVNVDLGVHVSRPPAGEWMAMAAETRLGGKGAALCRGELFDASGWVGASTQSLIVAAR